MITIGQTATAVAPKISASFLASGGTAPYVYSVKPGGAGGTINSSTGVYVAPSSMNEDPAKISDIIQVKDATNTVETASILVGDALLLFCDILQTFLRLEPGRVYLWNQKLRQPSDDGLYIAVSVPTCKPFGNTRSMDGSGSGLDAKYVVNMMATLDVDVISRGPLARDKKELVLMAVNSVYAERQQESNSFHIGRLPASNRFLNLSEIDGAAIPYRYRISFNLQYAVTTTAPVSYFNTFATPNLVINP